MAIRWQGNLCCFMVCRDLATSVKWYQDIFDAKLMYEANFEVDNGHFCELYTPVAQVSFGLFENPNDVGNKGNAMLVFGVLDIEEARAAMEAKGVRFLGPTFLADRPTLPGERSGIGAKIARFCDCDDNMLMLSQDI